jgi:3-hydroxybutyryl-CoA dehydratase
VRNSRCCQHIAPDGHHPCRDAYEKTHIFDSKDVDTFTASTGDSNPIHREPSAARAQGDHPSLALDPGVACSDSLGCTFSDDAGLPGCVLPGMLCASLFPAIIGSSFPGALYLSQTLKFRQPAMVSHAWKMVHARHMVRAC